MGAPSHFLLILLLSSVLLFQFTSCKKVDIIVVSTTGHPTTTGDITTQVPSPPAGTTTTTTSAISGTTTAVNLCGNGVVDAGEECDDTNPCCNSTTCLFQTSTFECRPSKGVCDVVEYCTGKSSMCPADGGRDPLFVCKPADITDSCSIASICAGSTANCTLAPALKWDSCKVCGGDGTSCTTGGFCGDGVCTQNETCKTCPYDCGFCGKTGPALVCDINSLTCNGHGYCMGGVCVCEGNYTGANCELVAGVSNIGTLPTTPVANIQLASNASQVQFSVSVSAIKEVTPSGVTVRIFPIVIGNNIVSSQSSINGATTVIYTVSLSNGARILINLFYSNSRTPIDFANQNYTLLPGTLKTTVSIFDWPWSGPTHQLQVVYTVSGVGTTSNTELSSPNGVPQHLHYAVDNTLLLGKFLSYALLDGNPKPTIASIGSTGEIVMTLPHFLYYAVLDPDFSTSIIPPFVTTTTGGTLPQTTGGKSSHKLSEGVIIGLTVGLILGVILFVFGLLLVRVYKTRKITQAQGIKVGRKTNADRGGIVPGPRTHRGTNKSSRQTGESRSSGSGRSASSKSRSTASESSSEDSGVSRSKSSSRSRREDAGTPTKEIGTPDTSPRSETGSEGETPVNSPRTAEKAPLTASRKASPRRHRNEETPPPSQEPTPRDLEEGNAVEMRVRSETDDMTPL